MKKNSKIKKDLRGFSMIEAIIAVFICGTTFVVFMSVLLPVLKLEFYQREQIMASNLAQEGIEIVRNIRDNNLKSGDLAFDSPFPTNGSWCVDYNDNDVSSNSQGCSVVINNNDGPGNEKFTRKITVSGSGDSREITSTVTWKTGGSSSDSKVEIEDTLYAWGNAE